MSKRLSKETLEKIRNKIKNGKSKYQTAAEFGLHPTVVYRWTQDLPGGQYGWQGIRGKRFKNTKFDNNLIERLQGTVRDRNKTQRGLKSEETTFVKGHQLYYNFIKPHETLNGYTPAHFANIYLNLGNNKWEKLLIQSLKYQNGKNEKIIQEIKKMGS